MVERLKGSDRVLVLAITVTAVASTADAKTNLTKEGTLDLSTGPLQRAWFTYTASN